MFPGLTVKVGRVEWRWTGSFSLPVSYFRPNSEGGVSGLEMNRIFPASFIMFPGLTVKVGRVQSTVKYQDLKEKNVLKRNTSKTVCVSGLFEHICVAWYRWRVAFYLGVFYYPKIFFIKKNLESRKSLHFWDCNLQVHLLGLSHCHRLLVGQVGYPVKKRVKLDFCIAKRNVMIVGAWVVFIDRVTRFF